MFHNVSLWISGSANADLNVTLWFKALIDIWILSFMNKIAWVIESERDLTIYLNTQQYTTINIRRDNIWFSHVVQAISGIFIIIKYIYNPMIIDIAFAV